MVDILKVKTSSQIKLISIQSTLSEATTLGARQSGRLREVVAHGKDQQNKPNTGLIN